MHLYISMIDRDIRRILPFMMYYRDNVNGFSGDAWGFKLELVINECNKIDGDLEKNMINHERTLFTGVI